MLGEAGGLAALGPQLQHLAVNLLETVDPQLLFHFLKKRDEHIAHHGRIIGSAVVVEGGQLQMLRHDVQLILVQLRQQVLRQNERVHIRRVEVQPHLAAASPNEADVKLRVVGRQRPAVHKLQECRQRLLQLRRVRQHGIGDAGQADDLRRQPPVGIHEGLEPLGDLAVLQHHGADLGDGLPRHLQARGLDVKAYDLIGEGLILRPVDGDTVVQIVDEIPLYAVEDLDLALFAGIPCLGERLHRAVVRDGDGGVAPGRRLRHHLAHIGQGVHGAHLGMEMQLHTLLRGGILPALVPDTHDAEGLELDILSVEGQGQLALHPQPHPVADGVTQHLGVLRVHVLPHRYGPVLVGHVEVQAPLTGPPRLVALHAEHTSLHHRRAHFQAQLGDGNDAALDLLAVQQVAAALSGGGRHREVQLHAAQIVLLRQHVLQRLHRRLRQRLPTHRLQLDGAGLAIQHRAGHVGIVQQQAQLARRLKALK